MADDFVEPSDAEFNSVLGADHTEPFEEPIYSVEEEEDIGDEYEGKPDDMSTYAWDNLNDTTKALYRDPNSAVNKASRNTFAKEPSDEEFQTQETTILKPSDEEFKEEKVDVETVIQTDKILADEELDIDINEIEIPEADFENIDEVLKRKRLESLEDLEEQTKDYRQEMMVKGVMAKSVANQTSMYALSEFGNEDPYGAIDAAQDRNDKAYKNVQRFLKDPNVIRSGLADKLLHTRLSMQGINVLVTGNEFMPLTGLAVAAVDMPIQFQYVRENIANGDYISAAGNVGLMGLTVVEGAFTTIGAGILIKGARKAATKSSINNLKFTTDGKIINASSKTVRQADQTRNGIRKSAEARRLDETRDAVNATVDANKDLKNQILSEMDASSGTKLSKEVDGVKILDEDAARLYGIKIAKELSDMQYDNALRLVQSEKFSGDIKRLGKSLVGKSDEANTSGISDAQILTGASKTVDDMVSPLLIPDKLNSIVAVAADLRKTKPELWDDKKTVIDNLYQLAAKKELRENGEITDLLLDYGLSFDDFTLAVVGSGSEAGKILQKLSMIRKNSPMSVQANNKLKIESDIAGFWKRIENIRRGGMVSMIKTASRNLQSTLIRTPTEGLVNVFETILRAGREGGVTGSLKATATLDTWTGSFAHIKYMFKGTESKDAVDYILKRPELMDEWTGMFDTVNEIRRKTNGTGRVLPTLEKGVDMLNVANRWQDHMTRRAIFLSKLRQLTKEHYGINLDKVLDEGGIADLLGNKTSIIGKDKPRFEQLIEQSTRRALEITYAAAPNTAPLREMSNFMTKYGLTTIAPFPRFMFSSMEYMAESAGGIGNVMLRRVFDKHTPLKGPLTDTDIKNISRNLVGMAAIYGAAKTRGYDIVTDKVSKATAAGWEMLQLETTGGGKMLDTTPLFPLKQYLFIGELIARTAKGTLDDWDNLAKDAAETFLGSNMRTGTGNVMIDGITGLLNQESDLVGSEKTYKTLGAMLGNYAATFGIPAGQIPEIQRALGYRTSEAKDVANDPVLGQSKIKTFLDNFIRPARQRGLTNIFSPSEEADLDTRQKLYRETIEKTRGETLANLLLGMRLENKDEEWGEYLTDKGLLDYKIGSRSKIPSIKRKETEIFKEYLPSTVSLYMEEEKILREEYNKKTKEQKELLGKEDSYINDKLISRIKNDLSATKEMVKELALEDVDQLIKEQVNWRRLSKGDRKLARIEYIDRNKKDPNYGDLYVMAELMILAKELKTSYMK